MICELLSRQTFDRINIPCLGSTIIAFMPWLINNGLRKILDYNHLTERHYLKQTMWNI